MPRPRRPAIVARKQPRQARSVQMVADIMEASIRVLRRDGGPRFTTLRVAEQAGISVGSIYQYFPNKGALLFRLQLEEWQATFRSLTACLQQPGLHPGERLRRAVIEFFRTEAEEADLRRALDEARTPYRNSREAHAQKLESQRLSEAFFREALPRCPRDDVVFLASFFMQSLNAIAERATSDAMSPADAERWATTTADLLCTYLENLRRRADQRPLK